MVDKIKREYKPEKIILFGSYAWGKPTKDSDIDLFIIKDTSARGIDRAVEIRRILDEENAIFPLDVLVYTPNEMKRRLEIGDDFVKDIIDKGKILYG
ncbi:MAG: nucleotidyltransferase domain-containing protein [Candidatus Zixiibacteriota bacterium]